MNSIIRSYNIFIVLILTVFLFLSAQASAQVSFTDNEAGFLAQNPNLVFQDFADSKVDPVQGIVCPAPANSESDNDCFSPGNILPGILFTNGPIEDPVNGLFLVGADFTGIGSPSGPALTQAGQDNDFEIVIDPGVNRVGLTIGCIVKGPCDRDIQVVVFDTNNFSLGLTTVHVTSDFNTFLGISSDRLIGNISLRNVNGEFSDKGVLNVWFGNAGLNIPTLSEWGMIAAAAGLMLVGVFFAVKRLRASKQSDAIG
ncbi:MAG: hypothetical protein ACREOP_08635 [Thermodesulfobacteriota bacterium]